MRIAQTLALHATLAHLHFCMSKPLVAIKAVLAKVHLIALWTNVNAVIRAILAAYMRLRLFARIIKDFFHLAGFAVIFVWAKFIACVIRRIEVAGRLFLRRFTDL